MLRLCRFAVAFCALALWGCKTTPEASTLEWRNTPKEVLLADEAYTFEVVGSGNPKSLILPRELRLFDGAVTSDLQLFHYGSAGLEEMQFALAKGQLKGGFRAGHRYLVHRVLNPWVLNKYELLCRMRAVAIQIGGFGNGVLDPICLRILCSPDIFYADVLLDEFAVLEQYKLVFPRDELKQMELGPADRFLTTPPSAPGLAGFGFETICEQCTGRNWGGLIIPNCNYKVPTPVAPVWEPRGPGPNTLGQVENIANREVVGAVNAVTPHPTDPDILYVGGVNGGIWRTQNAQATTPTWSEQTDGFESLSIGALEFDLTDPLLRTLIAGTGRFSSMAGLGGARAGLLRTTNGGSSWTALTGGGVLRGLNISGVAPRGAVIVLAANTADSGTNRGIWRSTDTGATWTQVSGAAGTGLPAGACFDLATDPGNAARLFTNGGGAGLFRSDDTGATWTAVGSTQMNGLISGANNVEVSVGAAGNVFVAIVSGRLTGLFRSPDGATGWTALDLPSTVESAGNTFGIHPGGQGRTHLSIAADPSNSNVVYIGGDRQPCFTEAFGCQQAGVSRWPNSVGASDFSGRLYRVDASQASGSQATALTHSGTASNSAPHADSRDMDVAANGVLIESDDGGVYRRTAPTGSTGDWFSMNGDLQTTEFHDIAYDARSNVIIGGTQDTGTPGQRSALDFTWRSVATADGGDVAVDDTSSGTTSTRYSSFQFLGAFRRQVFDSNNVFQSQVFPALSPLGASPAINAQFYTPIELNNVDATRLVLGAANGVFESLDQGGTVSRVSNITANNNLGSDALAYGATGNTAVLYVGSAANVFVRTTAAGTLTASASYPGGTVVDLAIDPGDPNTLFAVDAGDVFWTADGGSSWTTVSGNLGVLATGALQSLAFRGGTGTDAVVVGTDSDVFIARAPAFNSWSQLATGLPGAPIFDLDYDATDRIFVAGTLGRGAWVLEE